MMEEALAICRRNINNPNFQGQATTIHIKYAQMLSNYGLIVRDTGKLDKALDTLLEAQNMEKNILAVNSLARVETANRLGTVYHRQGRHKEAQKALETALAVLKSVNANHPYNATISTAIARLMYDIDEPFLAQSYIGEALRIRTDKTRCCGEIHTQVARCYSILGDLSLQSNDPVSAHFYFLKAHTVFSRLIERETTLRASLATDLGQVTLIQNWANRQNKVFSKLCDIVQSLGKKTISL